MFVYIYYLLLFSFDWMVFGVLIVVNMYMINLILISDVLEKDKKRSTRSTQIAPYLVSWVDCRVSFCVRGYNIAIFFL